MPEKDVVLEYNGDCLCQSGFCNDALRFYRELRNLGIGYNEYSFAGLLNVCVKFKELELTRQAHGQHGHGEEAIRLFDDMVRLRMKQMG
ncbi:hypothetical protein GH714_031386 [Hevea brasiliensis]|uniref:Pentatricopeptide repeat-containing protein n=1 Tax=Hevea brasiliensis TaxID=3981 RepID=A0A6A6LQW9_HEVBR|nr:hypothetical protein GH714_031386 [Hevea brasiliensis]